MHVKRYHRGTSPRLPGDKLRPWREVASEFQKRTGQPMTKQNAWRIAQSAEAKLRRAWELLDLQATWRGGALE